MGLQGEGEEEEEDAAPKVRVEDAAPVRAHLLGAKGAVGGEGWGERVAVGASLGVRVRAGATAGSTAMG